MDSVMNPTDKSRGLRVASPTRRAGSRRVRLHDCSPARDVAGSESICGTSEPTRNAAEVGPGGTVSFVDMLKSGKSRRVPR